MRVEWKDMDEGVTSHFRNTLFIFSALEGLDFYREAAIPVANSF